MEILPTITPEEEDVYLQRFTSRFPYEYRRKIILIRDQRCPAPAATAMSKDFHHIIVLYNPEFIHALVKLKPTLDLAWIGVHEMYHYLYSHLAAPPSTPDYPDRMRKLRACDCEVNSFIPDLQIDEFEHPLKYQLPLKLSWQEYYKLIPDEPEQPSSEGAGKGLQFKDAAGNEKEIKSICTQGLSAEDQQLVKDLLQQETKARGYTLDGDQARPVEIKPIPGFQCPRSVMRGVRGAIERVLSQELHQLSEKALSFGRVHKWKDEGYPGRKRARGPRLVFAVDASGSTSGAQLEAYNNIVRRLLKEYKATVVEFDDCIRHVGPRPSLKPWGGGTNFDKVQRYCRDELKNVDAIIWFTDADGRFSRVLPTDPKNVVVLTEINYLNNAATIGKVIEYGINNTAD